MKIKTTLSISRPSNGGINIRIYDEASRIEFVDANISLEEFAEAITGLSSRPMDAEIRGIEYIGKNLITEKRKIECPIKTYDKNKLVSWLKENAKEDGWILDTYLGSQNSVNYIDGKTILNYSVCKYVTTNGE